MSYCTCTCSNHMTTVMVLVSQRRRSSRQRVRVARGTMKIRKSDQYVPYGSRTHQVVTTHVLATYVPTKRTHLPPLEDRRAKHSIASFVSSRSTRNTALLSLCSTLTQRFAAIASHAHTRAYYIDIPVALIDHIVRRLCVLLLTPCCPLPWLLASSDYQRRSSSTRGETCRQTTRRRG